MRAQKKSYVEENNAQQPTTFTWEANLQKGEEQAI